MEQDLGDVFFLLFSVFIRLNIPKRHQSKNRLDPNSRFFVPCAFEEGRSELLKDVLTDANKTSADCRFSGKDWMERLTLVRAWISKAERPAGCF